MNRNELYTASESTSLIPTAEELLEDLNRVFLKTSQICKEKEISFKDNPDFHVPTVEEILADVDSLKNKRAIVPTAEYQFNYSAEQILEDLYRRYTDNKPEATIPLHRIPGAENPCSPEETGFDFMGSQEELNTAPENQPSAEKFKMPLRQRIVFNTSFAILSLTVFLSFFSVAFSAGSGIAFIGLHYHAVGESDMGPDIPKGSLVLFKPANPNELHVDDAIIIHPDDETYAARRITQVMNTYDDAAPQFKTSKLSGSADPFIVTGDMLAGSVTLSVPVLGTVVSFLQKSFWAAVIISVLLLSASVTLSRILKKRLAGGQSAGMRHTVNLNKQKTTPGQRTPKRSVKSKVSSAIFYVFLGLILAVLFIYSTEGSSTKPFFGYSYFTVLTTSMQSEIPKGSLILTKHVDVNTIEAGNDITFLRSDNSVVTHRVIKIYENYEKAGAQAFQTKGIENPMPDQDIVYADNVIGVVKFHVAGIGDGITYIKQNIVMIFILFGVLLVLTFTLKIFFGGKKKEKTSPKKSVVNTRRVF